MDEKLLHAAILAIVTLCTWVIYLRARLGSAASDIRYHRAVSEERREKIEQLCDLARQQPPSDDDKPEEEQDEYTHFAGTVVCGGGAYEVWGKCETSQDELAVCFRDIVGKQFMFASPDFELVKVGA